MKPEFSTVDDIACYHRGKWFHPSNMRFFGTRILPAVYQGSGGIFFVTSERFGGCTSTGPRLYTVRKYDLESDTIKTQGPFNELSKAAAVKLAKTSAAGENPLIRAFAALGV